MTDNDPRGDAVASLHRDLATAQRIPNDAARARSIERIHAAAAIELVEAVRDLTALVALAVQPPRWIESTLETTEPDVPAEPAAPAATTLGSIALDLEVGESVELADGTVLTVTASGTSEGSTWLELHDGATARRVFVDALARDEREVVNLSTPDVQPEPDEPTIVASAPRVDADAAEPEVAAEPADDGDDWPDDDDEDDDEGDDEEGDDREFDVEV